ncbi:hypothetical protein CONPUDRAFT_162818 [Coniophora puteana RWD-64-598 SS2]|uniref:NACHT domain-containing protein n=1 Tax=Coniophora puteana (strain RWD-64-598) TaxID=741705 RepID=A0A5M3N423_CONPW|nr:uncharacterized protein CONPUDRAFT_162818 [Coniophora puteana RWD-64-598 SS2]EIW85661.1 hypothetical protein CONPUDRAFT_162818 [Coniophora puteana RWD-64-598 SS2]
MADTDLRKLELEPRPLNRLSDLRSSTMQPASDAWQKLAHECVHSAIYDSNEHLTYSHCLPGTRVELLRSVKDLAGDGRRKIIWISGESGSGKSTVAHTLADDLRGEGKLAAAFFFSRKHTKRSTFDFVLLTLAYQIGLQHHIAKEVIVKAISDDPALLSPEKSSNEVLEKLVIEPLRESALSWDDKPGVSIILDALDEGTATNSKSARKISPFISLLGRLITDSSLPIRNVIIFSRPWPQIRSAMSSLRAPNIVETVRMEDYGSYEDVTRFFRHAFDEIYDNHFLESLFRKPWPPEAELAMLAERAQGRFIFAATVIRLIDQEEPNKRLRLVCDMLRGTLASVWGSIDQLYSSIIDGVDPTIRAKGLRYLKLIANLAEPLALSELNTLLVGDVHAFLVPFSALISIPSPGTNEAVETFHPSLRDFLQVYQQDLQVHQQDEQEHVHFSLAFSCFQTMGKLLKRNICGLSDPSLLHDEDLKFAEKRDAIPRALRYACLYWLHHLKLAPRIDAVHGHLSDFLQQRLLFVIEAYAVLGELGLGVGILREARNTISAWADNTFAQKDVAVSLLHDSWRLALDFFDPISVSALHVYESALPCTPAKSTIRRIYKQHLEQGAAFEFEEGLDEKWDCVLRVIDLKKKVDKAVLSPDASQVAVWVGIR